MAQYEIEFKIWGEYPDSYDGICQVELSDDEVQQLIALMQEHDSSDVEELELEANLPAIYKKIREACDDVAMDIVEKGWLDSAIYYIGDSDYDEDKLISYCQSVYGCPDFKDEDGGDFDEWLRCFWETATIKEQKELCFNYMGFDECDLCEVRCNVDEQYEMAIPQEIVEMANLKKGC